VAWTFEELRFLCLVVTGHFSLLQSIPTTSEAHPVDTRASSPQATVAVACSWLFTALWM